MTYQPFYRKSIASLLTVAVVGMMSPISAVHAVAVISEVTPVGSPTNNPTYVFNSDSTGTIAYGGPCTSSFGSAVIGANSIVFNTGSEGTVSLCTVSVDDGLGGGMSNVLTLADFFIDTSPASISINGGANVTRLINSIYQDPGSSWTDNDPNNGSGVPFFTMTGITATGSIGPTAPVLVSLTNTGVINTSYTGSYTFRYKYTDNAGNIATERVRTLSITTGAIPIITITAPNPAFLNVGDPAYVDAGATASDTEDLDLTPSIVESGSSMVDTNTPGTYFVTYNVTDSNGNAALQQTRTVFVNGLIPIITITGGTGVVLHELGTPYVESGATANGPNDGFVGYSGAVGSGVTSSGTVDWTQSGTYYVDYNYTDSLSVSAMTVTKTVIVADRTAPGISLIGSGIVSVIRNNIYIDAGANWIDSIDGSGTIIASGTVNTGALGSYILSYHHTDVAGNIGTPVSRIVNVTTGALPVIVLSGGTTLNILFGSGYTDPGFIISDSEDGDLTASGTASGTVNTSIPGSYPIQYSVTDSNLNTVTVTRTVNIIDNIPPVITLIGSGNISINAGQSYTDLGATWTDNADGSGTLVANGSVNTNLAGLYILSYNYTDVGGNSGTVARRNVTVVGSVASTTVTTGAGGGGGGGSVGSSNAPVDLNSAPVAGTTNGTTTLTMDSVDNPLFPSITRLLKNSMIQSEPGSMDTTSDTVSQSSTDIVTRTIDNPITNYICPVVSEVHSMDDDQVSNISEGEFTEDVRALLMYRGLDNEDLSTHYTERYFANRGYGIAKSNEAYEGDRAITRAEFVKMLVRALSCHYTLSDSTQEFSDVGPNAWYSEYINFATNKGWISGYDNGKFAPHSLMTRGEVAQVLAKAIQLNVESTMDTSMNSAPEDDINLDDLFGGTSQNIQSSTMDTTMNSASNDDDFNLDDLFGDNSTDVTTQPSTMDTTTVNPVSSRNLFRDVPLTSSFAPYIYALKKNGIINGKTNSFYDVNGTVSRNEIARIFNKTFINISKN